MEHTRVAVPEPEYLTRIGELAYTVASMEWTILGDLDRLRYDLPEPLMLSSLEPEMTSGIATRIRDAAKATDGPHGPYLSAVYRALFIAARIRNDVLHARPATNGLGQQRLYRAEVKNKSVTGERFWIDDDWFDTNIRTLNDAIDAVNSVRPPFAGE